VGIETRPTESSETNSASPGFYSGFDPPVCLAPERSSTIVASISASHYDRFRLDMKKRLFFLHVILVGVLLRWSCPAAEWKAYFGNLHSHTGASDGVDDAKTAYEWARDHGQMDFLCLSEHNHIVVQTGLTADSASATAVSSAHFVGFVGQEYSKLPPGGGNHINLYDVLEVVPPEMDNNYRELFHTWLPDYARRHTNHIVLAQFNHPASVEKDYGLSAIGGFQNYHGDWSTFVGEMDPWVRLIAIISGPADSNMSMGKTPPEDIHRAVESGMLSCWFTYLDRGLHLSPVADQDNHRHSWGTRTTARTGVWLNGALNHVNLLKALHAGRCFATEDKNLEVWFTLGGKPMGSRIADPGTNPVELEVAINDTDEPGSTYQLEVLRDKIGSGKKPLSVMKGIPLTNKQSWKTNVTHTAGDYEFYLVHVTQTHVDVPDSAWTAPIWIDPAISLEEPSHTIISELSEKGPYAGSKYSKTYHYSECTDLMKIKNVVSYQGKPEGKTLHKNCPKE
jgi:hypothetical protein